MRTAGTKWRHLLAIPVTPSPWELTLFISRVGRSVFSKVVEKDEAEAQGGG